MASRRLVQRELIGFQARDRLEDLVSLNQESVTKHESQLNSPLGAHILSHFIVKELGKDQPLSCVPDFEVERLELDQNMLL